MVLGSGRINFRRVQTSFRQHVKGRTLLLPVSYRVMFSECVPASLWICVSFTEIECVVEGLHQCYTKSVAAMASYDNIYKFGINFNFKRW
jgi:hypothetical protein